MEERIKRAIDELKTVVDQNGPDYLAREPFKVYEKLKNSKNVSKKTSGLILYALVNDMQSVVTTDMAPVLLDAALTKKPMISFRRYSRACIRRKTRSLGREKTWKVLSNF